ncbi:hypothetical protein BGX29_011565 [Mortierella sp. GBA35]|nr:hypothetical protein BGX29_011565 [Mortierella sp. GBA35]
MQRASLIPTYCRQCLALVRRTTTPALQTRPRVIFPTQQQQTPSVAFSSSHQIREAFLRAGPGRELGSAAARRHQSQQTPQVSPEEHDEPVLDPFSSEFTTTTTSDTLSDKSTTTSKSSSSQLTGYKEIVLLETDFRERFIKGGGNGGQKINKTNSNVELKHFETGIVVQCQATRSLPQNRKLARRILVERLDEYYNGDLSKRGQKAEKIREKKKRMARKSAKKYHGSGASGGLDEKDGGIDEMDVEVGPGTIPESTIRLTTLEEILAGDNKKPSRRKAGRANN